MLVCVATAFLWLPLQAHCHPIDEIQSQALIDLQSRDGRSFETVIFLSQAHVHAYQVAIGQLDLPPTRYRQELALTIRQAFSFPPCELRDVAPDRQLTERANGSWTGFRFDLRCPVDTDTLELRREYYNRDKTRTTLLWTIETAGREPVQALLPPHLASLKVSLLTGAVVSSGRGTRSVAAKDTVAGISPTAAPSVTDYPAIDAPFRPQRPPLSVLWAWFQEGALHLAFGVDHLLFLLTLVLAAPQWRGLLVGVTGFSVGHLTSMAVALALGWGPVPLLDVVIGATIALSAWRSTRRPPAKSSTLAIGCAVFGLIHGLGFGQGLAQLTGGVDSLVWPLLCFGGGLDVAQMVWVALAATAWAAYRRSRGSARDAGDYTVAASIVGAGGVVTGLLSLVL